MLSSGDLSRAPGRSDCRRLGARVIVPSLSSICTIRFKGIITRVTNTLEEIYKQQGIPMPTGDEDSKEVTISNTQVLYPELGSLEGRVSKFYLDELFANTGPDLEETAYWFHTPEGGWQQEPIRMEAAEEAPVTFVDPFHAEWEEEGRISLGDLEEGTVITGLITDIWLYHGCQIDFGYQYDGLIPMHQDQWMEEGVREALMPGDVVRARVFKIRRPGLYRWPVQLEMIEPTEIAANHVMDPEDYVPPIDHAWCGEQGWSMEQILEATGRTYEPMHYLLPQQHNDQANELQRMYGFDVEQAGSMGQPNPLMQRMAVDFADQISDVAADLT
jgi:hypothetical protein